MCKTIRSMLLATGFALAGCGGGGGYVASTPPAPITPTPTPTPTPAAFVLVPTAKTSQQFTAIGASRAPAADPAPHLGAADQLQVRYVASSNSYEVLLPNSPTWIGLTGKNEIEAAGGGVTVLSQFGGYQYSNLIEWSAGSSFHGVESVGIATPAGSVPTTGSATFNASAFGTTSESTSSKLIWPAVMGSMTFSFDFAQGALSGSFKPFLDPEWHDYELGTFTFRDTVYSTGSTTFSGKFDTNLAGVNSFSGLFTGPNAQELIGNFAFPYASPIDGLTYQVGGAFVGKK